MFYFNTNHLNIYNFFSFFFRFMKRQHLMDVTEAFRFIDAEKRIRIFKLGFYLILFVFVLIRFAQILSLYRL